MIGLHIFFLFFSTRKEAITIMGEAKHLGLTGKSYVWIATQAVIGANLDAPEEFPIGNIYKWRGSFGAIKINTIFNTPKSRILLKLYSLEYPLLLLVYPQGFA